jgi:hypothetical protein
VVGNGLLIFIQRVEEEDGSLAVGFGDGCDHVVGIRLVQRHELQLDAAQLPRPATPVPGIVVEQERGFAHAGIGQEDEEALGAGTAQDAVHGGEQGHAGGDDAAEVLEAGGVDALAVRRDVVVGVTAGIVGAVGFAAQFQERAAVPLLAERRPELAQRRGYGDGGAQGCGDIAG